MSYKVKEKDTLSQIAKDNNMTLDELLKLNGISKDKADFIRVGQNIKVSKPVLVSKSKETPQNTHVVVKNDNLSSIAKKYNMPLNELLALNNIAPENANFIRIGDVIKYKQGENTPIKEKKLSSKSALKSKFKDPKNVQVQLKARSYDTGSDGESGNWGQDSQAAFDKAIADGYVFENGMLYKPISKDAPQVEFITPTSSYIAWQPTIKTGRKCGTDGCAKYANDALIHYKDEEGRNLYSINEIGGHAWTRLGTGKNVKMIYSGYDSPEYDKANYSEEASDARNFRAADRLLKEFDSRTLDPNKVYMVNMFYKGSPSRAQAWEEAYNGTTGTHTGNLYFNKKTGKWHVSHNIHNKVYDDVFTKIQGSKGQWGVTAIAEAPYVDYTEQDKVLAQKRKEHPFLAMLGIYQKGGPIKQQGDIDGGELPEVTVTNFKDRPEFGWQANQFIRGMNDSRKYMMDTYGWSDEDFSNYGKIAMNLAKQESDYGRGKRYIAKAIVPDAHINKVKRLKGMWNWAFNDGEFPWKISAPSKGLTQIKYRDDIKNPVLKRAYNDINIYNEEQLMDPRTSAAATLVRLHHNNQDLQGRTIRYLDETEIPFAEQHGFMWNAGRLTDMKNRNIKDPTVEGYSKYVRNYINNADYK